LGLVVVELRIYAKRLGLGLDSDQEDSDSESISRDSDSNLYSTLVDSTTSLLWTT